MKSLIIFWICFLLFGWASGGLVFLNGTRLFDVWIFDWLRYDQLIHFLNSVFLLFIINRLLKNYIRTSAFAKYLILGLVVMGIGAVYEILELGCVVFLGSWKGVGDYMNNALDLFFNFLGTISGIIFLKCQKIFS